MTPKPTSRVSSIPLRFVIVTLDTHLSNAASRAAHALNRTLPGLTLNVHAASNWDGNPEALERCKADIAAGDIIFVSMMFMEDHFQPILETLRARRDSCDAMVCCMSSGEVVRLTKIGRFNMSAKQGGPLALLKRLRGSKEKGSATGGAHQMRMLRRIPKILRFIPGPAQDVRAYFLSLQYWLAGSEQNIVSMVRYLIDRYASGPRETLRGQVPAAAPQEYPEVGLYHPRVSGRVAERADAIPPPASASAGCSGTVGLLVMRSYVLAGNTSHYDGVIDALESRGLRVLPAFASGLDARPAIERYFRCDGVVQIDALVSLTGFSLVGGPAYNDSRAAQDALAALDVPFIAAHPLEFQTLAQWQSGDRGLMPIESTMMVAIPELDGATGPIVFGGRGEGPQGGRDPDMRPHPERAAMLSARVARLVTLRRAAAAQRRVAIVLFNFPPNSGSTGTAAHLSVFESLFNTLKGLKRAGYSVELPRDATALRCAVIEGNAAMHGAVANVLHRIPAAEHVRREPWLAEIEAQWGPAPGRAQSDGSSVFVLGRRFGNVLVGIQPGFGYEGDPARMLFEKTCTPTHAFSAFYRYLREDFDAHAVLHFGTHGALEFMPGKQVGMTAQCWPDRLIGDLPNLYLYASNNPSEGTLAKRRTAATLISYITPPVTNAGLYRGLSDLKSSIERWRTLEPQSAERQSLTELVRTQAAALDLAGADVSSLGAGKEAEAEIEAFAAALRELESTLIPCGLHVVGEPVSRSDRAEMLMAIAQASHATTLSREQAEFIAGGGSVSTEALADQGKPSTLSASALDDLQRTNRLLSEDYEIPGILHALAGGYMRPAPGGDLLRTPDVLPTGRNLHGFDPFRIPSALAVRDGARQAERLVERCRADGQSVPESVAVVLWGTDNLKTEGGPIAQALALIGALPRFDAYGRLTGAELVPLSELGRPRIDVIVTISGIFRDLLPLQIRLLAEASLLAASAEEAPEKNFVRKHALAYQQEHGCDLETASLRVFGNSDGAYGANVGMLIDSGNWTDENEIAETYTRRKCFAYGRTGAAHKQPELLRSVLADVDLAYQNLDSVEVGVTTVDTYFDTLGGIASAARRVQGSQVPIYIGDQTCGEGAVRSLDEQVALEARTRTLNPKWYEEMLKHGYEGVRHLETHLTNTLGWSATTGKVAPWIYARVTETFVLDPEMRKRISTLNPASSARMVNRLLEAEARKYWSPDEETLRQLRTASDELEDRLEGVFEEAAA